MYTLFQLFSISVERLVYCFDCNSSMSMSMLNLNFTYFLFRSVNALSKFKENIMLQGGGGYTFALLAASLVLSKAAR